MRTECARGSYWTRLAHHTTLNAKLDARAAALCSLRRLLPGLCGVWARSEERKLATDEQLLFDKFLEPVDGTTVWDSVELEVTRRQHAALNLSSKCRQHTLEIWMFHNMDSCCLGFVYRGQTDFIIRLCGQIIVQGMPYF